MRVHTKIVVTNPLKTKMKMKKLEDSGFGLIFVMNTCHHFFSV